jgi:hypothetical protein
MVAKTFVVSQDLFISCAQLARTVEEHRLRDGGLVHAVRSLTECTGFCENVTDATSRYWETCYGVEIRSSAEKVEPSQERERRCLPPEGCER